MARPALIAALGSSFAAGPGIPPVADAAAMRSGANYPHLLAARLGAALVDLTVSSATTANLLDTPQETLSGVAFAPQVEGVPRGADVVTVTAGGNDLRFIGGMLHLAWERTDPTSPVAALMRDDFPDGVPPPTDAAVAAAADGLVAVVEEVRRRAPQARVVLVDYLTVLDSDSAPATPFTEAELAHLLAVQRAVCRVVDDAARRGGADLIRASTLSADHALGSPDPWVQAFQPDLERTIASFHPTAAGMAAVAAWLEELLA